MIYFIYICGQHFLALHLSYCKATSRVHRRIVACVWGGRQKIPWNMFIKNCVFILTCLNFGHLQSTLHLMQYAYRDVYFLCSEQFLNSSILTAFSASVIFCFTPSTLPKGLPLRTFFIQRNKQKKSCSG